MAEKSEPKDLRTSDDPSLPEHGHEDSVVEGSSHGVKSKREATSWTDDNPLWPSETDNPRYDPVPHRKKHEGDEDL